MVKQEFVKVKDVAREFGVNNRTVLRWINDTKLEAVLTPGGHHRIRVGDLDKFIKEYRHMSSEIMAK